MIIMMILTSTYTYIADDGGDYDNDDVNDNNDVNNDDDTDGNDDGVDETMMMMVMMRQ